MGASASNMHTLRIGGYDVAIPIPESVMHKVVQQDPEFTGFLSDSRKLEAVTARLVNQPYNGIQALVSLFLAQAPFKDMHITPSVIHISRHGNDYNTASTLYHLIEDAREKRKDLVSSVFIEYRQDGTTKNTMGVCVYKHARRECAIHIVEPRGVSLREVMELDMHPDNPTFQGISVELLIIPLEATAHERFYIVLLNLIFLLNCLATECGMVYVLSNVVADIQRNNTLIVAFIYFIHVLMQAS